MKKTVCLLAFACLLFATATPAAAVQDLDEFLDSISDRAPQTTSERVGVYDAGKLRRQRENLHRFLTSERVAEAAATPMRIEVGRSEIRQLLDQRGAREYRMLAGVTKPVEARVDLGALADLDGVRRLAHGAARGTGDGLVWSGVATSAGAYGVRVHFTDVSLPRGAALYVYNAAGDAFGPYTGRGPNGTGEFWSNMVPGDTAFVQLRQPAGARGGSFNVAGIGHVDHELLGISPQAGTLCSFNAECVESAACTSSAAVADAQDAVAHIQFVSGRFIFLCSGGLLTDTDTATTIPHFLTANHCISQESEADSMEAFFFFEATTCGGGCYDPDGAVPSTLGADILAENATSDYTLMRLSEPAPSGAVLMGWNASAVANSNGTALFRISHPQGAPQGYSEHVVDTSKPTCGSWPRGNWIYSRDTLGATEGGSSGSPVVNGAGQVVGQLSGACGFNVNDVCDAASNATVDGAFAAYFPDVAQFLDPSDGGDPGDPPPGECLAKGASCSSDAECCSNRCRGGRNKSCK